MWDYSWEPTDGLAAARATFHSVLEGLTEGGELRQDAALRELRRALAEGQDVLAVHYACENLNDAKDRPPAIACIAVSNLKSDTNVAFSLSDQRAEIPVEEREKNVLERFYNHLMDHRDAKLVHWNMNSSLYGFDAIALRYRFLAGEDPSYQPPVHLLYDLDTIIGSLYGDVYVQHPKLYHLASLNRLSTRSFLHGGDEAKKFAGGDIGAVKASTSAKARIIGNLLEKLCSGTLQTQTSVGRLNFAGEQLEAVDTVLALADRFLYVKRSLQRRYSGRPAFTVSDEYDAQDLFRSLLCVFFDDIRPEEWTPSYAGAPSRVDFLLPEFRVAIELKHTRESLTARKLGEELIVDVKKYSEMPNVSHLICLVFDYDGRIQGPRGVEADLSQKATTDQLAVNVRIFDR